MSSYNLVNGVHAANSKDLCTRIVRDEWGFEGVIMSDWNTTEPEDGSIPWSAQLPEMILSCQEVRMIIKVFWMVTEVGSFQKKKFVSVPEGY